MTETHVCTTCQGDCRGSDDGDDARLLMCGSFLVGDHRGQCEEGVVAMRRSWEAGDVVLRNADSRHLLSRGQMPRERRYAKVDQDAQKEGHEGSL